MDESAKIRYDTILVRDLLTELILNLKFSEHVIGEYDGPLKGSSSFMVDLCTYEFKYLNTGEITPKELFMNHYAEEIHESEQVRTYIKLLLTILDDKYERADFNKATKNKSQHLTET